MRSLQVSFFLSMNAVLSGACAEQVEPFVDVTSTEGIPIIGGAPTRIEDHPWQASLQMGGAHFCGGSVIDPRWILTAQHCVDAATAPIVVVTGVTKLSQRARQEREVKEVIRYPGYTSPAFGRDIALLELSAPLEMNARTRVISLATADDVVMEGERARTTGWGRMESGRRPDVLREADVPIVAQDVVESRYGWNIGDDQLGAGGEGRDTCFGDSGGPLTVPSSEGRVLVGVTSWGSGCGDPTYPGMYARVSFFAEWIRDHIGDPSVLLEERELAGAKGSFTHFLVEHAASVRALLSAGSGDADLYVRRGQRPTLADFDCRSFRSEGDDVCELASDGPDSWYVSVYGYSEYAGATLSVSGVATRTVIAGDDFTATHWSGGFGFAGDWRSQGDVAWRDGRARLRRDGHLERTVEVAGVKDLSLRFRASAEGFERDDQAFVRLSVDNGPFVTLQSLSVGDPLREINLGAFDGASSMVVRFDAEMDASTDVLYIDDVALLGT